MDFAITPCPNDTFSYYRLIEKIGGESGFNFVFHDIETLNKFAFEGKYEITKLSFPAAIANSDKYEILDAGAALGIGTGPVFVARGEWRGGRAAVPGLNTTAALLFKFWAGKNVEIFPMLYSEILPAFARKEIDAGVLIHEGRFVYKDYGLSLVQDLGEFWTNKTSHPVPLGCICIRRDVLSKKDFVQQKMRESIKYAFANFEKTIPLVKSRARHLQDDVLRRHITAFVNEYSYDISNIKADLIAKLGG
ncbi:MAG: 1,4-dihydroxy-6-naphthoate synthase [Opitutales bacterium]|nr:1,4-dihydroxy-6-naphthoate synthase [Opitutales bacterium]